MNKEICNAEREFLTRAQKKARKIKAMQSERFQKHMRATSDEHWWDTACRKARLHMNQNRKDACAYGGFTERYRSQCWSLYFSWKRLYKKDLASWRNYRMEQQAYQDGILNARLMHVLSNPPAAGAKS